MKKLLSIATAQLFKDYSEDINHLQFPRIDYIELQQMLNVEMIDYSVYDTNFGGRLFKRLDTYIRSDVFLSTLSWWKGRKYPLAFAWSERAGIPMAALKRFIGSNYQFVTMFQCWSSRQRLVTTTFGLFSAMDHIIVHCASMKHNLIGLGVPDNKISIIHYSIDQIFFSPPSGTTPQRNMIMSIGEPKSRNYPSLFQAVDGLDVNLKVAASGHWYSREKNAPLGNSIPENVSIVRHLPQVDLRNLYASSQFVVLPILDLVYSAGATVALEAASMGKAVIAFRSRGIADYILDGETGILVEPGNISELRQAIQYLLSNPTEMKRLGQNARQRIDEELNLETYVGNLANVLNTKLLIST